MSLLKTKYVPKSTGLFAVFDQGHVTINKTDGLISGVGDCIVYNASANLGSMKFTTVTSPSLENCNTRFKRARNTRRPGGGNFFAEENENEAICDTSTPKHIKPDVSSLPQTYLGHDKTQLSTSDINCNLKETKEEVTNPMMAEDAKDVKETKGEIMKPKMENGYKDEELEKFRGYIVQLCSKHSKYKLDIYCNKCESFICVVCKLLNHVKHEFVDISLLPKESLNVDLRPLPEMKHDFKVTEKTAMEVPKDFNMLKSGIFYKTHHIEEKSRKS